MQLSPGIYHIFVRPKIITKYFAHHTIGKFFDFSNSIVLDFGCGIGSNSFLFPTSGYIGLDCDCSRIDYAKKHYPNYKFITSKNNKIPLPNHSVDYIIILSVLHHISNNHLHEYFSEFHRILKTDGMIIAIEPCLFKRTYLSNWFMHHMDKGDYIRNEASYLNMFKASGYHASVIKKYKQLLLYNKIFIIAKPR